MSRKPLHIVPSRGKHVEEERVGRTNTRVLCGFYTAELIMDPYVDPPIWHCIVQRAGSADILYWGQELTFAAAESAAEELLKEFAGREREKKARAGH